MKTAPKQTATKQQASLGAQTSDTGSAPLAWAAWEGGQIRPWWRRRQESESNFSPRRAAPVRRLKRRREGPPRVLARERASDSLRAAEISSGFRVAPKEAGGRCAWARATNRVRAARAERSGEANQAPQLELATERRRQRQARASNERSSASGRNKLQLFAHSRRRRFQ